MSIQKNIKWLPIKIIDRNTLSLVVTSKAPSTLAVFVLIVLSVTINNPQYTEMHKAIIDIPSSIFNLSW